MRRSHARRAPRTALLLAALSALAAAPSASLAQKAPKIPKRPELPAGSDTNSAAAYQQVGLMSIKSRPAKAADAFYWAGRLDPSAGQVQYARYVAKLLEDRNITLRYFVGDEGLMKSKEIKAIDSLALRAFQRDPFIPRQLFAHVTQEVIYQATGMVALPQDNRYPEFNARMAYERGNYADAVKWYAHAIKKYPKWYMLHDDRADAFFLMQQYDSAAAELNLVLEAQRKRDAKKLVYAYESKAFTEFKIGWALAHKGDIPGAREAYGRALVEDISFWRAHEALADVALAQGDTAIALQELDLAVQIAGTDPVLLEKQAVLLASHAQLPEATAALQKAIASEPYYARPYFYLARLLQAQGKNPEALAQYREYLARAAQGDDKVASAKEQVAALTASGGN